MQIFTGKLINATVLCARDLGWVSRLGEESIVNQIIAPTDTVAQLSGEAVCHAMRT